MIPHLTLTLGQGPSVYVTMNFNADRDTLRALADEGNELALDRLADLADQRADLEELSELLDEGCMHAGELLTARAIASADLLELQRISDAGYSRAGSELNRLLGPSATASR
jgi:hypothetical protein